jgi:hypothetical protein
MAKYDPLEKHLSADNRIKVDLPFDKIALLVGGLPRSVHEYREWWSNDFSGAHTHALAWDRAGYRVSELNLLDKWVRFVRQNAP